MKPNWLEVKRQSFHLIIGIIIVITLHFDIIDFSMLLFLLIITIMFSIIAKFSRNKFLNWLLDHLDRPHDRTSVPGRGAITYLIGVVIVIGLFERNIALASILIMAVGDSVSPVIGMHFAKTKHILNKKKKVEGTIAGIIAATIAASIFINFFQALIASITAMAIETIDFKKPLKNTIMDDNITMPIISAVVIYLLRML